MSTADKRIVFERGGEGCFQVFGPLTFITISQLAAEARIAFDSEASSLLIDLQGVEHTDSAGLSLLVEWMRDARRQNRQITFKNLPAQMLAIANVSGLKDILPLH